MDKKPIVLIVDDSDDFREIWRIRFSIENFEVLEAKSGKEALEILKNKKPDIILIDFLMPEMNGVDLYLALKKNPETKDIKVFFLTSMDRLDDEIFKSYGNEFSEELKGVPYISKTRDLKEVLEIIKNELKAS
ncbi:MAG: response regulator [Patescibacteria group bacterium]|nr:response regulator [Patescibacteria group bacterium]